MKEKFIKYRFLILIAVLIPSIFIVSSLLTAILLSVVLAYIIRPVAERVEDYTKVRDTAVFIAILIVITPVILGFIIAGYQLSNELSNLSEQIDEFSKGVNEISIISYFSQYTDSGNVEYLLRQLKNAALNFAKSLPEKALSLPHYIIQIILIPFITFYLIRDRHHIYNQAAAGFLILGVPYAIILGFLAMIAALLPIIGASTVTLVVCSAYILVGDYTKAALIVVFTITFLILFMDFVVRPRVVCATTRIHPLLVILGFTGGPLIFGIAGFVLGPAILGAAKAVIDVLNEELRGEETEENSNLEHAQ